MILLYGADTANVIKEEIESMKKSLNGYFIRKGCNQKDGVTFIEYQGI